MTDRLAELEELLDRATPAPWEDASTDNGPFDYEVHTVADDSWSLIGLVPSPHDARLIARLVTAAPDLLAAAKAARDVLEAYDNAEAESDWTGALVDTRLRAAVEAVEADDG